MLGQGAAVRPAPGDRGGLALRIAGFLAGGLGGRLLLNLFQGQFQTFYNQMMAVALITILPLLILFLVAQKAFIEGANMSGLGGR